MPDPEFDPRSFGVSFRQFMDRMAAQPRFATFLRTWLENYLDYSPHAILENVGEAGKSSACGRNERSPKRGPPAGELREHRYGCREGENHGAERQHVIPLVL